MASEKIKPQLPIDREIYNYLQKELQKLKQKYSILDSDMRDAIQGYDNIDPNVYDTIEREFKDGLNLYLLNDSFKEQFDHEVRLNLARINYSNKEKLNYLQKTKSEFSSIVKLRLMEQYGMDETQYPVQIFNEGISILSEYIEKVEKEIRESEKLNSDLKNKSSSSNDIDYYSQCLIFEVLRKNNLIKIDPPHSTEQSKIVGSLMGFKDYKVVKEKHRTVIKHLNQDSTNITKSVRVQYNKKVVRIKELFTKADKGNEQYINVIKDLNKLLIWLNSDK